MQAASEVACNRLRSDVRSEAPAGGCHVLLGPWQRKPGVGNTSADALARIRASPAAGVSR